MHLYLVFSMAAAAILESGRIDHVSLVRLVSRMTYLLYLLQHAIDLLIFSADISDLTDDSPEEQSAVNLLEWACIRLKGKS
jgi:hypothetical protein